MSLYVLSYMSLYIYIYIYIYIYMSIYIGWASKNWNTLFLTVTSIIFIPMSLYFAHGIIWLFGACGTNFR